MREQYLQLCALFTAILMVMVTPSYGQTLSEHIGTAFEELLVGKLQGSSSSDIATLPFSVSTNSSTRNVVGAMANLITTNASAFPLSSSSSGLTFDLSSGIPVASMTSTGPIFADRATTLGKGRMNLGFNYSQRNLGRVRGLETDKVSFQFTRWDINSNGLGDDAREWDTIELTFDLDFDATVLAFYGTYGVTDRLDLGFALPIINLHMKATPKAFINSITYQTTGSARYYYAGSSGNPTLATDGTPIDEGVTGLGDIALRGKYHLTKHRIGDLAALFEARLPTGDEENFLGTGDASFKFMLLASQTGESISPHINLGFDWRLSDLDRNDIEVVIGYDQKISEKLTMAIDWQAEFEVGGEISDIAIPEPTNIGRPTGGGLLATEEILITNIPNFEKDNIINTSFGIKYSPSPKWLFVTNFILPNNNGGIRSDLIFTFGMEAKL